MIVTEWPEFRNPDFEIMRRLMAEKVIFDGRNLYEPKTPLSYVFAYYSIGRPDRHLNNAGAVHQHLDRPDLRFDRSGGGFGCVFVGHVSPPGVTPDLFCHCLGACKLAIKHHDFGAGG